MSKLLCLALFPILVISCNRIYVPASPVAPTVVDTTPKIIHDTIAFRVTGNAISVKVKYSDSVDGLNQITTTLPFQVSFDSIKDNVFISLEATSNGFPATVVNPFVEIQVTVNGILFREASTSSFFNDTISVSGTYHR